MGNVCFSFEVTANSVFHNIQQLDTEITEGMALWAADLGSIGDSFPVHYAQRTLNRNTHAQ